MVAGASLQRGSKHAQDREVQADVQVGKTCLGTGEDEGQHSTSVRPSASCIVGKALGNQAQLQLKCLYPRMQEQEVASYLSEVTARFK